ncbi:unnamed protein product [Urochloa decumbens]|uniref:Uncharacterized protein n=1 Tax=Urochloa decumbens TaxID=240449 RepID=A0ABC9ADH7_9POAL
MAGNSLMAGTDSMEPWRELFRGRDIYDVIGNAILIAATDSPKEFRRRRDGIVEQIYTAPAAAIAIPTLHGRSSTGGEVSGSALQQVVSEKGSKVASCTAAEPTEEPEADEIDDEGAIVADKQRNGYGGNSGQAVSESGIDWLQTLADEMDEEAQEINEVLRIKEILLNHHEQSTDILFDSLRRLQLMHLTADKIKFLHGMDDDGISEYNNIYDSCFLLILLFITYLLIAFHPKWTLILTLINDIAVTNVITGMDKGGSSGSYNNRKYDGMKPSDTVPRNKDLILVQDLPETQRQPSDKMNPQKLPPRQRTPSKNTDLTQTKRLNADGNSSLLRQQCQRSDLPARQEPALLQKSNIQKTQEQGSQVPRIRIKIKHSSPGCAPRRGLFEKILEKKPCEENSGTIAVARNPPLVAAARDLPSGQAVKTGMPTQSSAELNKLGTGRKVQLANMNLDETKRKLHGAYQEAENAKKKRAIQVVKPCDIPKSKDIGRTPLTTSTNPHHAVPPLSNALAAALKRAYAHRRRIGSGGVDADDHRQR